MFDVVDVIGLVDGVLTVVFVLVFLALSSLF